MQIEQFDRELNAYFKATEAGVEAGIMSYSHKGKDIIVILHTEVDKAFSGKGIGKALLMELVKYARENNFKVLPLCPFARAMFNRIAEIRDVLV